MSSVFIKAKNTSRLLLVDYGVEIMPAYDKDHKNPPPNCEYEAFIIIIYNRNRFLASVHFSGQKAFNWSQLIA